MKVDISTIVMLLTEEDLLEKCAISNFEFCIENILRYIENRDLFNPDFFISIGKANCEIIKLY